ncbi:sensor histidine kinase [Cohnella candidum]|uniref:histidine kinase n=1 Tax=Cohnella candidum TaxID=2674991 RepID=A0A3G3K3I4_9BACL|nr:sensor histidine kinase [Cohnella candidum]AYQ75066.1 sensor histidine kinase [Cohnella candidum]
MSRSSWRHHLPLFRTMGLLVSLLALIGWGLSTLELGYEGRNPDRSAWQWAPASSFEDAAPPSSGWIPFESEPDIHNDTRYFWLRLPLPADAPRDPALWIFNAVSIRVFDGNRLLYDYDPGRQGQRINLFTHWNLVPLPTPLPSEVYVLADNRGASRPAPWIQTVSKGDLYIELLRKDSYSFVLSALFLFTAFTALGLYIVRRDRLQLYFSLLSFCGFYSSLVRNYLLQVYWDQPWLAYMDFAVFPLGVYALVSIMGEVFPSTGVKIMRRLRQVLLGYTALTLAGGLFFRPSLYGWLISYPLLAVFLGTAGIIFWQLRIAYRERQGPDSVWMLSGFIVVAFFSLIHVFKTYLPSVFELAAREAPGLNRFPFDLVSVGLFLFLLCLIRVILYRFGVMNERLQHTGEFLEESVRARTSELEERTRQLRESSTRLAQSTRETAETIASTMVLEERNRITGNIHDTVGHALTATIIQLEAAKRLLDRDPRLALDKLTASQGLIRRGLEEIRQSVRLLKDDFSRYDLTDAMIGLIGETEQTTDAEFDVKMEPLPDTLTTLQKRVLYQALQEGITNALRHGGSTRFVFTLTVENPIVFFRLESNGRTYEPSSFGFGLKAMSDRVSELGGVMSIEPGHPGCVLLLSLPYREPRHQELV